MATERPAELCPERQVCDTKTGGSRSQNGCLGEASQREQDLSGAVLPSSRYPSRFTPEGSVLRELSQAPIQEETESCPKEDKWIWRGRERGKHTPESKPTHLGETITWASQYIEHLLGVGSGCGVRAMKRTASPPSRSLRSWERPIWSVL